MMLFDDLRDNEWALVEALFCAEPARSERRGRPRVEAGAVVNAVVWGLSTGEGWAQMPGRYPSPPTCRRRFDEWRADGTLAEIVKRLGTSGREISLCGLIFAKGAKPHGPPSRALLPARFCAPTCQPVRPPDIRDRPFLILAVISRNIHLLLFTARFRSAAYRR